MRKGYGTETSAECTARVREANQGPRFVKFQLEERNLRRIQQRLWWGAD